MITIHRQDKEKEKEAVLPNPAHRPFGLVLFENPVAAGRCLDLLRTSPPDLPSQPFSRSPLHDALLVSIFPFLFLCWC